MNIPSLLIDIVGLVFLSWLVWIFYQMYLASWGRDNAKAKWLKMFSGPFGLLIRPFFKWFILIVFSVSSFVLILLGINYLMQITLIVMGE